MMFDAEAAYADFEKLRDGGFPISDLDPICDALDAFQKKHHFSKGWRLLPNRVVALAAVRTMEAYERESWERD